MSHTKTITINGMTCQNCVNKVNQGFLDHSSVLFADIQLAPAQSNIKSSAPLNDEQIQKILTSTGNYTLDSPKEENKSKSFFMAYRPLIVAFSILIIASLSLSFTFNKGWMFAMHVFMGGFFLLFSFLKLIDLKGFAETYQSYDLLAKVSPPYGYLYPFLELGLGLAYINFWNPSAVYLATMILMGFSSIGVIQSVLKKQEIQCACMGSMFDLKMTTVTIIEDVLMVAMAAFMFFN